MTTIEEWKNNLRKAEQTMFSAPHYTIYEKGGVVMQLEPGTSITINQPWGKEIVTVLENGAATFKREYKEGNSEFEKYAFNHTSSVGLSDNSIISFK